MMATNFFFLTTFLLLISELAARGHCYSSCAGPVGIPGTCKPLALCAQYYATPAHYDERSHYYKSCVYGYGYKGVCCPDVYYGGHRPDVIHYRPRSYRSYDVKGNRVPPEAIKKAVEYAIQIQDRYYRNDKALGRNEDHPSYWGNGVVTPTYLAQLKDYADTGFFITLVTEYLQKEYGYKPEYLYSGGLKLVEYGQYLPPKYRSICHSYYKKCRPSKYRSYDGSCNNLRNPFYGQSRSAVGYIHIPKYSGGNINGIKVSKDGSPLPLPRALRSHALPDKNLEDKDINMMFVNYGQFVVHDVSYVPFYQAEDGLFLDCCFGYHGGERQVNPKCYAVAIPQNDDFYHGHHQSCLNMARAIVGPNYHCAAGYASKLNYATSFLDLSIVYGTTDNRTREIRAGHKGYLKTSFVGGQHYMPIDKEEECFNSSRGFCFKSGDLRTNLHPGLIAMQTVALRLHNYCAKHLSRLNPYWHDEKTFEECRRITIAVFQHITYNEYLPIVLGWKFMYDYGILPPTKGHSYDYDERVVPWTYAEFTAAAFRLHSSVYGKIALVNNSYYPERVLNLEDFYNSAILYKTPGNFDKIVRGYVVTKQRRVDEYYDQSIGELLLKDERHFGLDLVVFNIQRGRDYGLASYNDFRELCGLPRAKTWKDFYDVIDPEVVNKFSQFYKSPEDVELYVGGVAERHVRDSVLGPTWWCIAGYQFQNWKKSDRYFYTEGGHPHSFTIPQLNEIRKMSLAAVLCWTTGLREVPVFALRTPAKGNRLVRCDDLEAIPRMSFAPWVYRK